MIVKVYNIHVRSGLTWDDIGQCFSQVSACRQLNFLILLDTLACKNIQNYCLTLLGWNFSDLSIFIFWWSRGGDLDSDDDCVEWVICLFDLLGKCQGQMAHLLLLCWIDSSDRRVVNTNDFPITIVSKMCLNHLHGRLSSVCHHSVVEQGHNIVHFNLSATDSRTKENSNTVGTMVLDDMSECFVDCGRCHWHVRWCHIFTIF